MIQFGLHEEFLKLTFWADEGLTLKISALETLYGHQFTLN